MTMIGRAGEFAQIAKQPSSVPWMVESNFGTSSSSPFSCLLRPSDTDASILHSSSKGKLLRHRLRPLRVCRLSFSRLLFCSRGRNRRFFAGLCCIWTLASDLLQLSLGPAVGLHTTFFGLVAFSAFFAASSLGTLACLSSAGAIRIFNGLSRSRRAQPTETQEWPTPTAAIRYRDPGTTWREQLSAVLLDTPCPSPS